MIAQASPEISFLLPTAPECSDHRYVAPHQPSKSELYKPQLCQNCAYETKVHRTLKEVTAEGHFLSFCLAAPVTLCYAVFICYVLYSRRCCTPYTRVPPSLLQASETLPQGLWNADLLQSEKQMASALTSPEDDLGDTNKGPGRTWQYLVNSDGNLL